MLGARRRALYAKHFILLFTFCSSPIQSIIVFSPRVGVSLRVYRCVCLHRAPTTSCTRLSVLLFAYKWEWLYMFITRWFYLRFFFFRSQLLLPFDSVATMFFAQNISCVVELTYTMNGSARAFLFPSAENINVGVPLRFSFAGAVEQAGRKVHG